MGGFGAYVEGRCNAHNSLGALADGAWVRSPPIFHEAKTKLWIATVQNNAYQVAVHSSCVCNEQQALYNRHLIRRGAEFDAALWNYHARLTQKELEIPEMEPISYREVIQCYTGGKRRTYFMALQKLRQGGLLPGDMKVSMFVKPDRYPAGVIGDKHPRAIQYRSPKFNLVMSTYIKPFEHWLYNKTYGFSNTRVVVKGLSPYERAELFEEKIKNYNDPVFLEFDHSKFDSTLRRQHIKSSHWAYQRAFGRLKFLDCQLNNFGYSKGGIRYYVRATRMSGDPDTGCGNSYVNLLALRAWIRARSIRKYDIMLDGDDGVVIIERSELFKVELAPFSRLGFDTKMHIKFSKYEVDFCQCRLMTIPRPNFVRNPVRAISHSVCCLKKYDDATLLAWQGGVGQCELALNEGVPVLSVLGSVLAREEYFLDQDMRARMGSCKPVRRNITMEARIQFWKCWGIVPDMQLYLEHDFTAACIQKQTKDTGYGNQSICTRDSASFCTLGTNLDETWSAISSECLQLLL